MATIRKKSTSSRNSHPQIRIAVKLRQSPGKRLKQFALSGLGRPWNTLRRFPLIESLSQEEVDKLIERARRMDSRARRLDFSSWYQIPIPAGIRSDELLPILLKSEEVETAYVMRPAPPPGNPSAGANGTQGYLNAKPEGIDAQYAWGFPGGDGAGIGFVDMERGWNLNHEDLVAAGISLIQPSDNRDWRWHGTSVLGEVLMVNNLGSDGKPIGGVGIAPAATGRVISQWRSTSSRSPNYADAIVTAVSSMKFGDVLLLEAQDWDPDKAPGFWPVEIAPATYDAIVLATALGFVVVEAAGDGGGGMGNDLDSKQKFDLSFRDSGAIIVAAGTSTSPHIPFGTTNYGHRIDCYAWGEKIYTTDTDEDRTLNNLYTSSFSGTSGAAAIIAGAALVVQGLAQASPGYRFSPLALRQILKINGTPSYKLNPDGTISDVSTTEEIGVMPNLKAIIDSEQLNLAPDIYLRGSVGDTGDLTTGTLSQSPDIIVRQAEVDDPQGSYGEGSGTENDPALSEDVAAGQTNFIYARVLNRGGSAANDVEVDLYWSPPATLVTPNLWSYIGTATLPAVPIGWVLTVSGAVPWKNPPAPGHYCFLALAGSAEDPKPSIPVFQPVPGFSAFDQYLAFIDNNNNVAWRNFNVVSVRSGPATPHSMPFLIPGAFDTGHDFTLEALGHLPHKSRAWLEIPDWLADGLQPLPCEVKRNLRTRTVRIPLHPAGLQRLGTVRLSAGSVANCKLVVKLPKDSRSAGELAVRQLYQHREVGRITWRFAPPVKKRPSKIFGKSESEKELVSANDLARVRTPLVIAE